MHRQHAQATCTRIVVRKVNATPISWFPTTPTGILIPAVQPKLCQIEPSHVALAEGMDRTEDHSIMDPVSPCGLRSVVYQQPRSPRRTFLWVDGSALSPVGGLSGCALYSGASSLSPPFSLRTFQDLDGKDPLASPL